MFVCPECGASQPTAGFCAVDGLQLAPNTEDPLIGQTVGVYRVSRLLGVGGMGRVYKGVHPQIGSRVAIKVLSRELSDRPDIVERFFSEARAVNVIRHESIVNVLDLARLPDGRPFIVMEFLDGAPLSAIVEQAQHTGQPLPLGGVARLAAEVLDALGAAHAKGIIHRDLKPDNIFVTPAGRAKVLDFGIAKLQPELGGHATHTGSLMGTPHYMSPEQAASRPADARADLYAMGVILYECTTSRRPFAAEALFDLLRMQIEAAPTPPRALRPDMPSDLEAVILTALAKSADMRFGSAHAMSNALQHATRELPPEQWAPIVPALHGRPSSWQPTPPASWARKGAPATTMGSAGSGQITNRREPGGGSKTGLWLGIGAAVIAAGGITVGAIVASGGGSSTSTSTSGSGSGSAVVVATPPPPPTPVPEPPAPPDPAPIPAIPDLGMSSDEANEMIGAIFDDADADVIAMWPAEWKAAKKKYGTWSKVPKNVRAHMAGAGLATMQNFNVGAAKQINNALGGGQVPTPPTPPPTPVAPPTPAGPAGWFVRHKLAPPGFSAKRARVDQLVPWAVAEGKKNVPDAALTRIDIYGVFPDGHADLTLPAGASSSGDITFRFASPSHAHRDPLLPRGVEGGYKQCAFYVRLTTSEAEIYDTSDKSLCEAKPLPAPRCTVKQVWDKALAKRPDLKDAVAELDYYTWSGKPGWNFTAGDLFTETFPDDCR